jgi:beta-lactamase class A
MPILAPTTTRRALLAGLGAAAVPIGARAGGFMSPAKALTRIEANLGGRLGVAAQRLSGGPMLTHRADERFKMCSTFKLLLAAAVLRKVDEGRESLDRAISYGPADILGYAPAAKAHLAQGSMSMQDLCAAAVTLSDNTAANLLLGSLGGPAAVTAFAQSLGDGVTRLDRNELALNTGGAGDPRDTTSPAAAVADLRRLAFGDALSPASRARLVDWLTLTQTGLHRLRAGVPASARMGDKTGTYDADGTANDIAIIWPARGEPILVAAYATGSGAPIAKVEAALAEVGKVVFAALAEGG